MGRAKDEQKDSTKDTGFSVPSRGGPLPIVFKTKALTHGQKLALLKVLLPAHPGLKKGEG